MVAVVAACDAAGGAARGGKGKGACAATPADIDATIRALAESGEGSRWDGALGSFMDSIVF